MIAGGAGAPGRAAKLRQPDHQGLLEQTAVGQVVQKGTLPGGEDDSLQHHVVEADAVLERGAPCRELGGQDGQAHLEELEHPGRDVGPGGGAPLGWGGSGHPEHLGGDAVEEQRVALLVAALQEEDPGLQGVISRLGERSQVLGDGVLGHAEAAEEDG